MELALPTEIRQVIANCHLFSGLDPGLMDDIAASATRKKLGAHQLLFQKGDRADALWGVLSGRIVIEVRADDGKKSAKSQDTHNSGTALFWQDMVHEFVA